MRSRTIFGILAIATALSASAQSECGEYWRFAKRASDMRFHVNGQSAGASVEVGVPTELNIIIYKGQDYRISFVYDEKVIGDHVVARIIEKVREPKVVKTDNGTTTVFADSKKVIWDNEDHDMADEVEFTASSTKRIAVEITAPGIPDSEKKKKDNGKRDDIGCVGILIEHMSTPNIGF